MSTRRRAGNIVHQPTAMASVAQPPSTTAPVVPSNSPATPDSKAPSSLEAPMNTFSTARTRPRMSEETARGTSVLRMNTLTASAPVSTAMATKATAKLRVIPSTIVTRPNAATAYEQAVADVAGDGLAGQAQRDQGGADAPGGPQPTEAHGVDPQLILGDGRQQGHRTAEQHREQVEGDGPEQDRLAADEAQALEGLVHCRPGRGAPRGSPARRPARPRRLRAPRDPEPVALQLDQLRTQRRGPRQCGHGQVGQPFVDGVEGAAQHRAHDHGRLPGDGVAGHQPGELLGRHDVGGQ